jgi:TonB family protein
MAQRRFLRSCVIGSLVLSVGVWAVPHGNSTPWASTHDRPQMINKKPTMKAPTAPAATRPSPQITAEPPTTLDGYIDYVSNRLQVEAMKVQQQGSADVKLTIDKSGEVKLAEVVRVNGPSGLSDEVVRMVDLMGSLPPLPSGTNVGTLVLTSTVVFNYPSRDMYDRFGERAAGHR